MRSDYLTIVPKNKNRVNFIADLEIGWGDYMTNEEIEIVFSGSSSECFDILKKYKLLTKEEQEAYDKGELLF